MARTGRIYATGAIVAIATLMPWFGLVSAQDGKRAANADHGGVIAAQGAASVPACAQCHAFSGASDSSGAFPKIGGQSAFYLEKQMHDYASSERANAIMSPIAKALSADDIADLAAYYAKNGAQFPPLATADAATVEKGRELAHTGDPAKSIPACNTCHGPDGAGIPPAIPYLAGQYAQYIVFALQMWKRGFRKGSPMDVIANQLDEEQSAAVGAYYQQIRPATPSEPARQ
jgi:cytochrome c553